MPSWIENAFWRKGIAETHYHNDQQCHFARYLCTPPVQLHRGAWRDPRFRTGLPNFYLVPNLHTSLCQPFGRRCAIGMASTRRRCRVKHLFPQQDPLTATCPLVAGACWSDAIQPIKNIGAQFNTEVPSGTKNRQRTAGRGEEFFLGLISCLFSYQYHAIFSRMVVQSPQGIARLNLDYFIVIRQPQEVTRSTAVLHQHCFLEGGQSRQGMPGADFLTIFWLRSICPRLSY